VCVCVFFLCVCVCVFFITQWNRPNWGSIIFGQAFIQRNYEHMQNKWNNKILIILL